MSYSTGEGEDELARDFRGSTFRVPNGDPDGRLAPQMAGAARNRPRKLRRSPPIKASGAPGSNKRTQIQSSLASMRRFRSCNIPMGAGLKNDYTDSIHRVYYAVSDLVIVAVLD